MGNNKTYLGLQVECQIILSNFKKFGIFMTSFHKHFTEIHPVVAILICKERQVNGHKMKLVGAFHNFANTPKMTTEMSENECAISQLTRYLGDNYSLLRSGKIITYFWYNS